MAGEAAEAGEAISLTDLAQQAVERDLHVSGCHFTATTSTYPAGNDVFIGSLFRARSCLSYLATWDAAIFPLLATTSMVK